MTTAAHENRYWHPDGSYTTVVHNLGGVWAYHSSGATAHWTPSGWVTDSYGQLYSQVYAQSYEQPSYAQEAPAVTGGQPTPGRRAAYIILGIEASLIVGLLVFLVLYEAVQFMRSHPSVLLVLLGVVVMAGLALLRGGNDGGGGGGGFGPEPPSVSHAPADWRDCNGNLYRGGQMIQPRGGWKSS
ncbi:hypothetical protein [Actinomadura terrae]|uniref:hypothetical protein n=1 Tax=Actinomadura terrae TaxID=604353 RepID=UPI001FA7790C|nr:hypothetical protein [Actinomadura terrae]